MRIFYAFISTWFIDRLGPTLRLHPRFAPRTVSGRNTDICWECHVLVYWCRTTPLSVCRGMHTFLSLQEGSCVAKLLVLICRYSISLLFLCAKVRCREFGWLSLFLFLFLLECHQVPWSVYISVWLRVTMISRCDTQYTR